ncbi:MAG: hypothetical protein H8E15_05425 [Planctomycetes bacterium]|nr:hypothetical protein [Planctomycetota bacterium]
MAVIDPEFLAFLRCPVSRKPLVEQGDWLVSTDPETRLRYPIRDGIPVLLEEEAEKMAEADWQSATQDQAGAGGAGNGAPAE